MKIKHFIGVGTLLLFLAALVMPLGAGAETVTDRGVNDAGQAQYTPDNLCAGAVHTTTLNDQRHAIVIGTKFKMGWENLRRQGLIPGALSPFAPMSMTEPDVAVWSPGRTVGFANVYGVNLDTGEIAWQPRPWFGPWDKGTPDPMTMFVGALIDDDGNSYVMDEDQVWSWDRDGNQRWVVDSPCTIPWIGNASIVPQGGGLIAGTCSDGTYLLMSREDGSIIDTFVLEGLNPEPCDILEPIGFLAWITGFETTPKAFGSLACGAIGLEFKITETQAMDPETGRIFQATAGSSPSEGFMRAYDIVPGGPSGWHFAEAWSSLMGASGDTSPTIHKEEGVVYASDDDGVMYAFAIDDGYPVAQSAPGLQGGFSPQIAYNNYLINANGDGIVALTLEDDIDDLVPTDKILNVAWQKTLADPDYQAVIDAAGLPVGPTIPGVTDGVPTAKYIGICTQMPDTAGIVPMVGYRMSIPVSSPLSDFMGRVFDDGGGPAMFNTFAQMYHQFDPDTGDVIPGSTIKAVPETGTTFDGGYGHRYNSQQVAFRAEFIAKLFLIMQNVVLANASPEADAFYRQDFAIGGLTANVPESYRVHTEETLTKLINWTDQAVAELDAGRLQNSFDTARMLAPNCDRQVAVMVEKGNAEGEFSNSEANQLIHRLRNQAAHEFQQARDALLGDPTPNDVKKVRRDLLKGKDRLEQCLGML
ncbi:MAG: hypothetical protein HF978_09950 [Desulfobacteraceae bacterium]|nr:hypothetical protein [Desulfobacteraceae bacterium]MBC2755858.1 hypothetical protein [Desulfobacteraceae bacterium]